MRPARADTAASVAERPPVSMCLQVGNEYLQDVVVRHDAAWLEARLADHIGFWEGAAPPRTVQLDDDFKCRYCAFQGVCPGAGPR